MNWWVHRIFKDNTELEIQEVVLWRLFPVSSPYSIYQVVVSSTRLKFPFKKQYVCDWFLSICMPSYASLFWIWILLPQSCFKPSRFCILHPFNILDLVYHTGIHLFWNLILCPLCWVSLIGEFKWNVCLSLGRIQLLTTVDNKYFEAKG